jgi:hypothetical protein
MSRLAKEILNTISAAEKNGKKIKDQRSGVFCTEVKLPGRSLLIPDPNFSQPPVSFENKHGLSGISRSYQLPPYVTARDLQNYCILTYMGDMTDKECRQKLQSLWRSLKFYNPSLRPLQYNPSSTKDLYHLAMGVASAFNEEDIQAFVLGSGPQAMKMWESKKYKKLTKVFNKYAGKKAKSEDLALYWVATPATLKVIKDQFKEKIDRKTQPR